MRTNAKTVASSSSSRKNARRGQHKSQQHSQNKQMKPSRVHMDAPKHSPKCTTHDTLVYLVAQTFTLPEHHAKSCAHAHSSRGQNKHTVASFTLEDRFLVAKARKGDILKKKCQNILVAEARNGEILKIPRKLFIVGAPDQRLRNWGRCCSSRSPSTCPGPS